MDTIATEWTDKVAQCVMRAWFSSDITTDDCFRWFKANGWTLWAGYTFIKWVPCQGRRQ